MSKGNSPKSIDKPFIGQILELTMSKLAKEELFTPDLSLALQKIFETNGSDLPAQITKVLKTNPKKDENNRD